MIRKKLLLIFFLTLTVAALYACTKPALRTQPSMPPPDSLQLKITIGEQVLYSTFSDNRTTRDFINRLPLTLTMGDITGREKYSSLPQALSKEGPVKTTFQEGDIAYWLGGGLAVFYHQDNSVIEAGLIVIARVERGLETFALPGSVTVKLEAVRKNNTNN